MLVVSNVVVMASKRVGWSSTLLVDRNDQLSPLRKRENLVILLTFIIIGLYVVGSSELRSSTHRCICEMHHRNYKKTTFNRILRSSSYEMS